MLCVANGQSRARVVFIQNKRIRRFAVNTTRCSPPLVLMTMKSLFAFHEIFSLSLWDFFFRSMLHLLACTIYPKTLQSASLTLAPVLRVLPLHFRISFVCRAFGLVLGRIAPCANEMLEQPGPRRNVAKTTRYY